MSVMHYNTLRYYDPEAGRYISRDSIEEDGGMLLYGFCFNDSINWADEMGLWGTPDHKQITKDALMSADLEGMGLSKCNNHVLDTLTKANIEQDNYFFGAGKGIWGNLFDRRRHFLREIGETYEHAKTSYTNYIADETKEFKKQVKNTECDKALASLGRLSHSWQDFYGHSINLAKANQRPYLSPTEIQSAWSLSQPLRGTPDSIPPGLVPSLWGDEHYTGGEALDPMVLEYELRKRDATAFVSMKLKSNLAEWAKRCNCSCGK